MHLTDNKAWERLWGVRDLCYIHHYLHGISGGYCYLEG